MTQASHTAQPLHNNYVEQESITLPDSLNEFEGEEFQSPNLYQDSLTSVQPKLRQLGSPADVDSLQFAVSPTPNKSSQSPEDSLIEIKQSTNKINAADDASSSRPHTCHPPHENPPDPSEHSNPPAVQ